jgi:hypothetical protein
VQINHNFHLLNKGISNYDESSCLPRHRWYHYKEGFSPNLVDTAINCVADFNKEKDVIFDPFNGSGTVTLHSSLNGYKSKGYEVNPFSSFVSNAKQANIDLKVLENLKKELPTMLSHNNKITSPLLKFSTFTECSNKDKWLFNSTVLNSFENVKQRISRIDNGEVQSLLKLASLNSIMENSNAQKDGKCLRYKKNWEKLNFSSESFFNTFEKNVTNYIDDIIDHYIPTKAEIKNGDCRKLLEDNDFKYRICITSPPYLNSFDYTDIYRPELFLGDFINTPDDLLRLRKRTLRSHINLPNIFNPKRSFGFVYESLIAKIINQKSNLWSPKIPAMIEAYFEDMEFVLKNLRSKASKKAQLWLIVANSAYADVEIPTDLILAEIGGRTNWYLKEIGVLRYINKRGTKYSPNVDKLRESVIIFSTDSK